MRIADHADTFYAVLGLALDASPEAIVQAYRMLAHRHHPDRNPHDADAVQRFQAIGAAYDVLRDPAKRAAYDRQLGALGYRPWRTAGARGGPPPRPAPHPTPAPAAPTSAAEAERQRHAARETLLRAQYAARLQLQDAQAAARAAQADAGADLLAGRQQARAARQAAYRDAATRPPHERPAVLAEAERTYVRTLATLEATHQRAVIDAELARARAEREYVAALQAAQRAFTTADRDARTRATSGRTRA